MCGVEAAKASLFHDRIYCLTPTPRTSSAAVRKVCALVDVLGAHVRFLEATEHDRLVAAISHLPFLASVALMNTVAEDSTWQEASLLAALDFVMPRVWQLVALKCIVIFVSPMALR